MKISAYCKCSMIDDGTNMSAVIFTAGCNMNCPYCHNRQMLEEQETIRFEEIRHHLNRRKDMLDSVVVSGGEPTIHNDLPVLLSSLRGLGYRIKLDTNGSQPEMLGNILKKELVDHVAMDIKGPADKYEAICGMSYESVEESIWLLRDFGNYEFRTTAYPLLSYEDLEIMCRLYKNDPYWLQQYRPTAYTDVRPYGDEKLYELANVYNMGIRGL